MKIGGFDYLSEMNNRIQQNLQDFSTNTKVNENVTPAVTEPQKTEPVKPVQEPAKESEVKISDNGNAVLRAMRNQYQTAANYYAPINFSTNKAESGEENAEQESQNANAGNQVLNQYRFFVPTTQYEGTEGVVRRIFG